MKSPSNKPYSLLILQNLSASFFCRSKKNTVLVSYRFILTYIHSNFG